MDIEKYSERARGFLQAAQTIALREGHQRLTPEHLLKALMDDDQGMASNLIRRAGGDPAQIKRDVDLAVARQPKVSGSGSEGVYLDPQTARLFAQSEEIAKKAKEGAAWP